jgi:hypothetical protein
LTRFIPRNIQRSKGTSETKGAFKGVAIAFLDVKRSKSREVDSDSTRTKALPV